MKQLRLIIADDHLLVRSGLKALLSQIMNVTVAGEAADGHEALRLIGELRPDIALLDISMPGLNGIDVAFRATKDVPETGIIILSMHADREYVVQALRAGALGYVLKDADTHELEEAIYAVSNRRTYLCSSVAGAEEDGHAEIIRRSLKKQYAAENSFNMLTPRQREILHLIAEGLTTKEIASKLDLSVKTIETHRSQIMDRLNIRDIAGLVRYAVRSGIVRPD
jgi:DNA-binding NarL/FixJ family response regulator